MIKKLKGIPVWFIAALLIAGTVAGAGLWILTVEVPVDYDEPVKVYYSSEDMIENDVPDNEEDWFGPLQLRDTRTTDPTDLTYGTLHDYVRAEKPEEGKDPVELTVEIQAYDDDGNILDTDTEGYADIGFVVIPADDEINEDPVGLLGPREISWEYDQDTGNRDAVLVNGEQYDVEWGFTEITRELGQNDEFEYTVISVVAEEVDESPVDVQDYEIVWELYDSTE